MGSAIEGGGGGVSEVLGTAAGIKVGRRMRAQARAHPPGRVVGEVLVGMVGPSSEPEQLTLD